MAPRDALLTNWEEVKAPKRHMYVEPPPPLRNRSAFSSLQHRHSHVFPRARAFSATPFAPRCNTVTHIYSRACVLRETSEGRPGSAREARHRRPSDAPQWRARAATARELRERPDEPHATGARSEHEAEHTQNTLFFSDLRAWARHAAASSGKRNSGAGAVGKAGMKMR